MGDYIDKLALAAKEVVDNWYKSKDITDAMTNLAAAVGRYYVTEELQKKLDTIVNQPEDN